MGQGNKTTVDVRKTSPRAADRQALAEPGGVEGAPQRERPDYCELAHTVTVDVMPGASLSVRDVVELGLASPPRVLSHGRDVGKVTGPNSRALERCIVEGYNMVGHVEQISPEGQRAELVVSGATSS